MRRAWGLALLATLAGAAAAQVYKWKDAEGRVHYSDSAPASASQQTLGIPRSWPGPAVVRTSKSPPATAPAAVRESITMYTTPTCGYCKQARAYLNGRGIPFVEKDVSASAAANSEFRSIGGRGVPVILVGAQRMDGYSEASLAGLLRQSGY